MTIKQPLCWRWKNYHADGKLAPSPAEAAQSNCSSPSTERPQTAGNSSGECVDRRRTANSTRSCCQRHSRVELEGCFASPTPDHLMELVLNLSRIVGIFVFCCRLVHRIGSLRHGQLRVSGPHGSAPTCPLAAPCAGHPAASFASGWDRTMLPAPAGSRRQAAGARRRLGGRRAPRRCSGRGPAGSRTTGASRQCGSPPRRASAARERRKAARRRLQCCTPA